MPQINVTINSKANTIIKEVQHKYRLSNKAESIEKMADIVLKAEKLKV